MIRLRALLTAGLCLAFVLSVSAQEQPAGDKTAEAFFKLRDDREAKVDQARLQQVMAAGLEFLAAHPTHGRAWNVATALAAHAGTLRDKKQAALREYWITLLKYELVNRRTARDQSEEQLAAWAVLGASLAGFEARAQPTRDNFEAYRVALDGLAGQPKGARFVVYAEREYLRFLFDLRSPRLEAQLKKLSEGGDKRLAAMAKEEANIFSARTTPWELAFTAWDGKAFEASSVRGRPLLVVFFSVGRETAAKEVAAIQAVLKPYKDVAVAGICLDGEESRAALEKFVKAQRLGWTIQLGGAAKDNEWAGRLNVKAAPASFLFNKEGLLVAPTVRTDRLEGEIKRVLGVK